jgi:hypothetical protein
MPRSPLPARRNIEDLSIKSSGGLSIPVISVNSGRRGSMMVQSHFAHLVPSIAGF